MLPRKLEYHVLPTHLTNSSVENILRRIWSFFEQTKFNDNTYLWFGITHQQMFSHRKRFVRSRTNDWNHREKENESNAADKRCGLFITLAYHSHTDSKKRWNMIHAIQTKQMNHCVNKQNSAKEREIPKPVTSSLLHLCHIRFFFFIVVNTNKCHLMITLKRPKT